MWNENEKSKTNETKTKKMNPFAENNIFNVNIEQAIHSKLAKFDWTHAHNNNKINPICLSVLFVDCIRPIDINMDGKSEKQTSYVMLFDCIKRVQRDWDVNRTNKTVRWTDDGGHCSSRLKYVDKQTSSLLFTLFFRNQNIYLCCIDVCVDSTLKASRDSSLLNSFIVCPIP